YNFNKPVLVVEAELKKDGSTSGRRSAYAISTAIPSKTAKEKFWAELQAPGDIPVSFLMTAAGTFHTPNQPDFSKAFVDPFFEAVKKTKWAESDHLVDIYFDKLFPVSVCSKALWKKSEKEMKTAKTLTPMAKRAWSEANDELARCVSIRENVSVKKAL
ncbi:MAG: hypothetical protein V4692_03875, partial [Bdellovibrionota bacterium]